MTHGDAHIALNKHGFFRSDQVIEIEAGQNEANITLNHEVEIHERVEVTSSSEAISPMETSHQETLVAREIRDLPVPSSHDLKTALRALPGSFFWGMVTGIIPALIFPTIFDTLDLYYFPLILVISVAGCIIGTYAAPPTDEQTLKDFYRNVRPWGFWKPIHEKVLAEYPDFQGNRFFWRDLFNVVLGTVAQTALVILPIYIILKQEMPLIVTLLIILVCGIILKKTWWDTLPEE